jgi:hypothetical protein
MSVVVIDDATREKLLAAGDDVVFRDSAGKVLGLFIRQHPPEDFEMIGTPFTEEEIARHMKESRRVPAAEVEELLRRLTKCE